MCEANGISRGEEGREINVDAGWPLIHILPKKTIS